MPIHLLPVQYPKDRKFYEAVLIETLSVYIHCHKLNGEHAYSKFTINYIMTQEDWGKDLYKRRGFLNTKTANKLPQVYNYFDYILAWDSVLA